MKKRSFTLIEIMTVIIIIGVLAGFALNALMHGRNQALRTESRIGAESLRVAITQYEGDYGMLPYPGNPPDVVIGEDENESDYDNMIQILAGRHDPAGDGEWRNPRRISYLSAQLNQVTNEYEFLDSWGQRFMVILDTDYDGEISPTIPLPTIPPTPNKTWTLNRSAAVWSLGNPTEDNDEIIPWD